MSFPPCIPNFGFFDSQTFLKYAFHTVTVISTPVYILGFYCIQFKTPEQMNSVKCHLWALHLWIIVFDYSISFLVIPFMLIPEIAGIPNGVLRYFGVPTSFQAVLMLITFAFMGISIISVYENRFFILCDFGIKGKWRSLRKFWLISHYLLIIILMIPVFSLIPDQKIAVQRVFQSLPCYPSYIYQEPVFVLASDITYHISSAVPTILFFFTETGYFAFNVVRNGFQQRSSRVVSEKTYQMHKQFFIAFAIQMSIPLIMVIIPITYVYVALFINYNNQAANNFCMITGASHGFVSTIVMIGVHGPYRKAVGRMIGRKKTQRQIMVQSANS